MFSQQNSEFQQDFYSASNISLFNQHFSVFSQQNPCIIRAEYLLTYSGRRGIGTAEEEVYTVEDWQQSIWREIRETNLLSPNCLAKENMFPQNHYTAQEYPFRGRVPSGLGYRYTSID